MQAVGKLVGDAEGGGVAGSGRAADFDQAGGGFFRDAEGEAGGAGHEDVGGEAIDEDGGGTESEGAEMRAEEFDFAEGQGGGGHDVVNAGLGEDWGSGLGAGAGHGLGFLSWKCKNWVRSAGLDLEVQKMA
jgi:hypothetical protein